jgi:hypothetical protein
MLSLEVVGPGDGLSTVPSQAVTATAAYSCDRTVAALLGGTGSTVDGDGLKIYHIRPFRIFGLLSYFVYFVHSAFSIIFR